MLSVFCDKRCLLLSWGILCQFLSPCQKVEIGQRCPDIVLKKVINYPKDELRLSEFKGRLVILDFWATNCLSCIQAFPHIDSLQKRFNGKVQIIAINSESADSTQKFFKKRKSVNLPSIPFVTGDKVMAELFPHIYVPHHVWVDTAGIVIAITNEWNTTSEKIHDFFSGSWTRPAEKNDTLLDYSEASFWLGNEAEKQGCLEYYSYLTKSIKGVRSGGGYSSSVIGDINKDQFDNRVYADNLSILSLIQMAYGEAGKYDFEHRNCVILKVRDSLRYVRPGDPSRYDEWLARNPLYCYRLMVPSERSTTLFQYMQLDLKRYFNINVTVEKRSIKCLVLVRKGTADRIRSKGGKSATNIWTSDSTLYIRNRPFDELVRVLRVNFNFYNTPLPFIDAIGYKGNVDITFNNPFYPNLSLAALTKALNKFNLDLVERSWLTDVLIVSEKNEDIKNRKQE